MVFPKIKDRLFSQSKNRVFFIAKTTQNELIAKPSSLSSHRMHNSAVQLLHSRSWMGASLLKKKKKKKYPLSICVGNCQAKGKAVWCLVQKHKRRHEGRARAISIYSFNSLVNKAWWQEGTLSTVTMQALYQPPTPGTINISALSDTHCMWASLALTPTAERNNELLKNMKQHREEREGENAKDWPTSYNRAAIDHGSIFLAGQSEGCWAPPKSQHSQQDLHRCFTLVLLLFPLLQFTTWNTACLYKDQQAVKVKSIKLVMFLLISWLCETTVSCCDQLWRITYKRLTSGLIWNLCCMGEGRVFLDNTERKTSVEA